MICIKLNAVYLLLLVTSSILSVINGANVTPFQLYTLDYAAELSTGLYNLFVVELNLNNDDPAYAGVADATDAMLLDNERPSKYLACIEVSKL